MSLKGLQRKHHHVWRHYLSSWCTGKNIWYITTTGKIANDSTVGLSREEDFYKVSFLTKKDFEFLSKIISGCDDSVKGLHMQVLSFCGKMSEAYYLSKNAGFHNNKSLKRKFDEYEYAFLEATHSRIENDALNIINNLSSGNHSILDDEANKIIFSNFLGHQFTRSKAFKELSLRAVSRVEAQNSEQIQTKNLFNNNWWYLSYFFGTNIGANIFQTLKSKGYVFLINNTNTGFVTSDNCVINVHQSLKKLADKKQVKDVDYYYALSSKFAIMVNESAQYESGVINVSENAVHEFNCAIAEKANHHIYADSKEQLQIIIAQLRVRNKDNKKT